MPVINGSAELICHKRSSILLGAATSYSNPLVRSIVSSLKYERIHAAGEFLGLLLARYVWQTGINISDYAIVPMPIHAFRKYTRGYNQADKIAESFARRISCPVFSSMLIRTRHTKSQTQFRLEERVQSVRDTFAVVDLDRIAGRRILLVDDVVTTGATMQAGAACLKSAGAKHVVGLAVAKA